MTVFSNLPPMLAHQDFQARHSDMLQAAQRGLTVDPRMQALAERFLDDLDHAAGLLSRKVAEHFLTASQRQGNPFLDEIPQAAAIGTKLRIRIPSSYVVSDGPGLTANGPNSHW